MTSEFPNSGFSPGFLTVSEVLVIVCCVRWFHSMVSRPREKQVRKISFWLVVSGLSWSRQRGDGRTVHVTAYRQQRKNWNKGRSQSKIQSQRACPQ